ncbi:hypothetical protein CHELA1G11_40027 [Hyphomicrobiales bacterium]|nr:hypothetical protein CHELA1G11_40027 [Hyphomicrobiales bacterium]CAH1696534.1 hypothetical protein CHELA1G2_40114 [Hyphomicrobiales bacterium]
MPTTISPPLSKDVACRNAGTPSSKSTKTSPTAKMETWPDRLSALSLSAMSDVHQSAQDPVVVLAQPRGLTANFAGGLPKFQRNSGDTHLVYTRRHDHLASGRLLVLQNLSNIVNQAGGDPYFHSQFDPILGAAGLKEGD